VQIVRQIADLNNTHIVCGTGDRPFRGSWFHAFGPATANARELKCVAEELTTLITQGATAVM